MTMNKSSIAVLAAVSLLMASSPALATIVLKFENENPNYDTSTTNVMFYGNSISATYNGGANAIALNQNYTFAELSAGVTVTNYSAGLIYVSLGNEMTNGRGSTQPSPGAPPDPDYNTRWNNVEITVTPPAGVNGDVADITGINLYAIPLKLQAVLNNVNKDSVGYNISGNDFKDKLGAITNNDATAVLKDANGNFLRVLGPTSYAAGTSGPYPKLDAYVTAVKDQTVQIAGQFSGNGSTARKTTQTYSYTTTFNANGDAVLVGGGPVVGTSHTIVIPNAQPAPSAGNLANQIYAANPQYTIDGVAGGSFNDNDVFSAGVRDLLAGFAIGFVGSTVADPANGGTLFKDEASNKWYAQTKAFDQVQTGAANFNAYAEVFFQNSNVYGFPYSDRLDGGNLKVQVSIGPSFADTLVITVKDDGGTAPMTFQQAVTNAIANASNPTNFLLAAANVVTIPDGSGTHGLQFDSSSNLIVRAPVTSTSVSSNFVGQTGVTIAGAPTTSGLRVTTGNELTNFYTNEGEGTVNGMLIRQVEKGYGMNNTGTNNSIVEYTVAANNNTIQRLTKNPDIATYNPTQYGNSDATFPFVQPAGMSTTAFNNFTAFYQQYRTAAYVNPFAAGQSLPFTQLGYTYFWGNGPNNVLPNIDGMSEFVLLGGTSVNVFGIYSTPSYIYTKNSVTGQFGNGNASFNVTGACDTLWAGHRFQQGVSRSASSPNTITIGSPSQQVPVSGGEGILIWSLNYTVTNNGFIAGATDNKFGIAGTSNIAILFKGDTSNTFGTPITEGINQLINAPNGTISSPGTAVKVENGNTTIFNHTAATITGTTNSIWLLGGTNTITNNGTISSTGTAIRIGSGTTKLTGSGTITGNIVLEANPTSVLDIGANNVVLNGAASSYTQGAGSTLKITANSATAFGNIKTNAASVLDPASSVDVTVGGYIANGTMLTVVNTSGAGTGGTPGTITSSSPLLTFTASTASGNLILTASQQSSLTKVGGGGSSNAGAVGTALDSLGPTATGDMLAALNVLYSLPTMQQITDSMESMHPNAGGSNQQASFAVTNQFLSNVGSRLSSVRSGLAAMGISTGDMFQGAGFWVQGLGSHAQQDARQGVQGYQYNLFGSMFGGDKIINDHVRVGLAGGYSYADVNSKTLGRPRDNINSFQGTVYASYDSASLSASREEGKYSEEAVRTQGENLFYVDAMFGFTQNNFDSTREVYLGQSTLVASAEHYGQQYSPMVEAGYTFTWDKIKNLQITPMASMQYAYLRMNHYTEEGAGAMNLKVDGSGFNALVQGLGMQFAYPMSSPKHGTFIPSVKGMWMHDYMNEQFDSTATFTAGGPSFQTSGAEPPQDGFIFSTSFAFLNQGNMTLIASYDWEIKDAFNGHTYYGTIRIDF